MSTYIQTYRGIRRDSMSSLGGADRYSRYFESKQKIHINFHIPRFKRASRGRNTIIQWKKCVAIFVSYAEIILRGSRRK